MNYTIGEFAQLLGVTTDTLRVYEKHGIINPLKDHRNNYRYFHDLDCRNILTSRWYRSLDISLKEISELTINSTSEQIIEKITEKSRILELEIARSKILLNTMNKIKTEINSIPQRLNLCMLKKREGIYRIKQTEGNTLLSNKELIPTTNKWMKHLPHAFYSYQIPQESFLSESHDMICNWGLAINEDDFISLGLKLNNSIEYIPPSNCVYSMFFTDGNESMNRKPFKLLSDYISEKKYTLNGNITGKIILTEKNEQGNDHSYIDAYIPIK